MNNRSLTDLFANMVYEVAVILIPILVGVKAAGLGGWSWWWVATPALPTLITWLFPDSEPEPTVVNVDVADLRACIVELEARNARLERSNADLAKANHVLQDLAKGDL